MHSAFGHRMLFRFPKVAFKCRLFPRSLEWNISVVLSSNVKSQAFSPLNAIFTRPKFHVTDEYIEIVGLKLSNRTGLLNVKGCGDSKIQFVLLS